MFLNPFGRFSSQKLTLPQKQMVVKKKPCSQCLRTDQTISGDNELGISSIILVPNKMNCKGVAIKYVSHTSKPSETSLKERRLKR